MAILARLVGDHAAPWSDASQPSRLQSARFTPVVDALLQPNEPFFVLADFADYQRTQQSIEAVYRDRDNWIRRSIVSTARMGRFSSDRTIREYARDIWGIGVQKTPQGVTVRG
jgi:starch phosphorylase